MLNDARKELLLRLFADGSELPPAARAAFVAKACGATRDAVLAVADVQQLGDLPGFAALVGR